MSEKLDCLIIRQPYASLIAFGVKRWEFRTYDCKKRGLVCIASSRGNPLKTADTYLNEISRSFPRGFALATAVLVDSLKVNNEFLRKRFTGEELVTVHNHQFRVASAPVGEPVDDIKKATKDKKWNRFIWVLEDVRPLPQIAPLQTNGSGSTWTKITLEENRKPPRKLDSFL